MNDRPQKAVVVLEYDNPDYDLFFRVVGTIRDALGDAENCKPRLVHVAIDRPARRVLDAIEQNNKEEQDMALRKHGEGEVLPDSEQQKTAAQQAGMSKESYVELQEENEAADGPDVG